MAQQATERPHRGISWMVQQSTTSSLVILAIGAISIGLALFGTALVLAVKGITPLANIVSGLQSAQFKGVLAISIGLGGAALVLGTASAGRMPTKISREGAASGAILGLQAAVLGLVLFLFVRGDVEKFARNYLDFQVIRPLFAQYVNGAKNTIILAFLSELFGLVLGLFLALLAISKRSVVRAPARVYINAFRGTPLIWQIIMIGIGLPIGLGLNISTYQAGISALSLNAAAYSAEIFRAGIQSIERGQMEAARGLGMSYFQAMRYAVVPQAVRRVIPPLMNEFVILIKDTALLIVLGLTAGERDLMNVGKQAQANSFNPTHLVFTGLGYLTITLPLIRLVNAVEKRLRSGLVSVA